MYFDLNLHLYFTYIKLFNGLYNFFYSLQGKDSVMACRNYQGQVDVLMAWNVKDDKSNILLVEVNLTEIALTIDLV